MGVDVELGVTETDRQGAHSPGGGCNCNCGGEGHGWPVLDARTIPHAVRHGAILGALDQLGLGRSLVLVAPHDPVPLLAQIEAASPGRFDLAYLERGPEAWRLEFTRRS